MAGPWEKYQAKEVVPDSPKPWEKFAQVEPEKSQTLPANAGLANFVSGIAGLPVDTLERGINLIRAAQGTVAGQFGLTDWMPPMVSGSVGGSQWIKEKLRGTGLPGLSPDSPAKNPLEQAQFDLVSRGGFIPGGFLPAAGSMAAEKFLGPEWAGVGAMTPQAAITGYNALRAPSLARQEQQNALRDSTLKEGREAGYVTPPTKSGGGIGSATLESIAGKAALGQSSALRNQKITNDLARREAGLPKDSPISVEALKQRRHVLSAPYRELRKISEKTSSVLDDLQETRQEATAYWQEHARQGNVSARKEAIRLDAKASSLESQLEAAAITAGKPALVNELREARRAIAKTHDVERALNVATGDVSAPVLGRMLDSGKPLSGGLATAGKFQQAFPHYMREGASVQPPTAGALAPITAALLGGGGYGLFGPAGAVAAAAPLMRPPTRGLLLSDTYQNIAMPNYGPAMTPSPAPQLLYQLGILNQPN
jgi:hypothetical protein